MVKHVFSIRMSYKYVLSDSERGEQAVVIEYLFQNSYYFGYTFSWTVFLGGGGQLDHEQNNSGF